jgi:hypothetical protein
MRYDLPLIQAQCREAGFQTSMLDGTCLNVEVTHGIILCFVNAEREADCLIGFEDTPWHCHDDLQLSDAHGRYVDVSYREIAPALVRGELLICELWKDGTLKERSLIHRDCNDELRFMKPGEEIRIRRSVALGRRE